MTQMCFWRKNKKVNMELLKNIKPNIHLYSITFKINNLKKIRITIKRPMYVNIHFNLLNNLDTN